MWQIPQIPNRPSFKHHLLFAFSGPENEYIRKNRYFSILLINYTTLSIVKTSIRRITNYFTVHYDLKLNNLTALILRSITLILIRHDCFIVLNIALSLYHKPMFIEQTELLLLTIR